jgi:hypothetical protein
MKRDVGIDMTDAWGKENGQRMEGKWEGIKGRVKEEGTYLDMHRRFPSDMKRNLGKSLHILKSRRFVRSKRMCSGIYYQLLSCFLTSRERR